MLERGWLGLSFFWDVFLPLGLTAVPAAIWMVLAWVLGGVDQPGRPLPGGLILAMVVLQTAGVVALAVAACMRYDSTNRLMHAFPMGVAEWRKLSLWSAVACITLFDLLANMGAAIPGGRFLLMGAVPLYFAYLVLVRVALWGAMQLDHDGKPEHAY